MTLLRRRFGLPLPGEGDLARDVCSRMGAQDTCLGAPLTRDASAEARELASSRSAIFSSEMRSPVAVYTLTAGWWEGDTWVESVSWMGSD